MTKPFPEFVALFVNRDDSLGNFARYHTLNTEAWRDYPTWSQLLAELGTERRILGLVDAGRTIWEAWSGEPADEDEADENVNEPGEGDRRDEDGAGRPREEHDEDDEEWLDDETFWERLGGEPAGSEPSTGYEDRGLDGWLPDGI